MLVQDVSKKRGINILGDLMISSQKEEENRLSLKFNFTYWELSLALYSAFEQKKLPVYEIEFFFLVFEQFRIMESLTKNPCYHIGREACTIC